MQPFDAGYRGPINLSDRRQATANRGAIKKHATRTAITGIAADLGTRQAHFIAQNITKARAGRQLAGNRLTIQGKTGHAATPLAKFNCCSPSRRRAITHDACSR